MRLGTLHSLALLAASLLASSLLPTLAPAQVGGGPFDSSKFRAIELKFKQSSYYKLLLSNKPSETYIKADFIVDGKTYTDVGVRGRGGQTWTVGVGVGKLPLKISFDAFVSGQRFMGLRSMTLLIGYEQSFLREVLSMRFMRRYLPAPRANFISLKVNGSSWGVYINVETTNKDFLKRWFDDADGNRYKGFALRKDGRDPLDYKHQALVSSGRPDAYTDLFKALSPLQLSGAAHEREVPKRVDVDAMHRYFACNTFLTVADSFPAHNFYIYVDPYHDQLSILPWDNNYSLRASTPSSTVPLWLRGSSSNRWTLRFQAHLRTMAEETDIRELQSWIADHHKLVLKAMQADTRWPYTGAVDLKVEAAKIVTFMTAMKASIANTLGKTAITFSGLTRVPGEPISTDRVWLTLRPRSNAAIKSVTLHSRSRGYFEETPMFDDGKHMDGAANDGVFGGSIPAGFHRRVEYYFSAEIQGAVAFHPRHASFEPYSYSTLATRQNSVIIHEILCSNKTGIADEKAQREDWIELFNPTQSTIDVGGMYLSDDFANLKQWRLPGPLLLPPRQRLLIWADDDLEDGPLHSNFKLSSSKDAVYLTDTDGTSLLDFHEFENQRADVSTGRLFDSISKWVSFATPTPLELNEPPSCSSTRFSAADRDAPPLTLSLTNATLVNRKFSVNLGGSVASSLFMVGISAKPDSVFLPQYQLPMLIELPFLTAVWLRADTSGKATLTITVPPNSKRDRYRFSMQAFSVVQAEILSSNGLSLHLCK